MEVGKLTVQLRRQTGKGHSRRYRAQGLVPGICYGAHLDTPLSIVLSPKMLKGALDPAKGRNTVIDLTVEDDGKESAKLSAMLWEYQIDALRRHVTHVDLIAIDPEKEIEVDVPIKLEGKPAGAVDGGQIHIERHSVPVSCRPADIPIEFVVDVSPLHIGDSLHISDLEMPAGVTPAVPDKLTLLTCVAPKADKESEAVAAGAGAEGEAAAAPAEGDKKEAEGGDKK